MSASASTLSPKGLPRAITRDPEGHAQVSARVNCLTLIDAANVAEWLGGRLLSQAEWAWAARSGGLDQRFPWGDEDEPACDLAVVGGCGPGGPSPVCSKPAGNSASGACDFIGNVAEFVSGGDFMGGGFGDRFLRPADAAERDNYADLSPTRSNEIGLRVGR